MTKPTMLKPVRYKANNIICKGLDTGIVRKEAYIEGEKNFHLLQIEKGGMPGVCFLTFELPPDNRYLWVSEDLFANIMETE